MKAKYVALDEAQPAAAVVVIDVLRAFTTVAWAFELGVRRVLAVDSRQRALAVRDLLPQGTLIAGEDGGRRMEGFDLGNSPQELQTADLPGRDLVLRTSAGTQGLIRTTGSGVALAGSFVVASATARALIDAEVDEVEFIITGASLGRDGDEDLACAELITALTADASTDPGPYVERIATSDAGTSFLDDAKPWLPRDDFDLACEVDRFNFALAARRDDATDTIELIRTPHPTSTDNA
ncbi:MAG: 2-phosphosulfolactate phosphatase [Nitriliruptoraceae bacterium]